MFGRKKEDKEKAEKIEGILANFPDHLAIKPNEKYVFHSDYFEIDDGVATILAFFHRDGSIDGFGPFWGVNKIPSGLSDNVSVFLFEQTRRMSENWLLEHQSKAEGVAQMKADSIALLNDFELKKLEQLNQDYNAQGISPGGSADMLALTIFVNFIIHF